ncbi:MAG: hypothetical protein COZ49_00390 [Candidatus Yonathbacteria bacterium CG_4_10_14_3_um_filter_47_65]|uniref:Uncharacterized protein n=2 Tax=Parcubacteria group TaxID=1794811 RepID=A0A2M8D7J6_9BACT|nr:MAG: hypothetical protein AUJ44_02000 [Candidatus Nomurabacteria bacterium CG1_02_47_685]PIP04178.1 MAG: hypothetical protein COX54_00575 [Candidatus Yonathbacteria bacterium CG23_combo_of_CG06-09_8_20_14_all_46_18]PIQ31842.1 MAG: hypothetical protein COW61_03070 [Candidatus Yonathbacteria bacterium CG17_big_fil_post_rev_8_21_14_2_50_46_19]PIX56787.1 MAG: hypothetical protein COZ49_00390 [Candidatus Yonathbacteria bacterium CG_4_10_14_3_um_filter_47_65]PIY57621.1 MAG: hypothetical protein CO
MDNTEQYKNLMSEIIAKQIVILGPEIAVLKARNVPSLTVSDDGSVSEINGEPDKALQQLIDNYVELSGQIVKNALGTIFLKYPSVNKPGGYK